MLFMLKLLLGSITNHCHGYCVKLNMVITKSENTQIMISIRPQNEYGILVITRDLGTAEVITRIPYE